MSFEISLEKLAEDKIVDQQKAFYDEGTAAVENGDLRLAYDIYYSWLNRTLVGKLKDFDLPHFEKDKKASFNDKEIDAEIEAKICNNFAILSSDVSERYEFDSPKRKYLYDQAVRYMEKAINYNKNEAIYYSTFGEIICEGLYYRCDEKDNIHEEMQNRCEIGLRALNQYKMFEKLTNGSENINKERHIDSLREESQMLANLLTWKYCEHNGEKMLLELLSESEDYKKYFNEFVSMANEYRSKSNEHFTSTELSNTEKNKSAEREEWENWKSKFSLMEIMENKASEGLKEIQCLLFIIDEVAVELKRELQWKEYYPDEFEIYDKELDKNILKSTDKNLRTIAYYTTLKTAKHIFDEMLKDDDGIAPKVKKDDSKGKETGKNCLTVMHAKYMNDSHEGLKLLESFRDGIDHQYINSSTKANKEGNDEIVKNEIWSVSPNQFMEEIFDDYFVFLKSFTQLTDKLIMWNRYASDPDEDGRDSNGCLVEFDGRTFEDPIYNKASIIISDGEKDEIRKLDPQADNFHLHKVIYLSSNGEINPDRNKDISDHAISYYKILKKLLCELNECLCREDIQKELGDEWGNYIICIRHCLQQSFRFITFLFKDDIYADEKESRMVFTRGLGHQELIRVLDEPSGGPGKLCINPFFQIYVKKITFGPNVRNPEILKPYFQYQLNKMWQKSPSLEAGREKQPKCPYEIDISEINYRTY